VGIAQWARPFSAVRGSDTLFPNDFGGDLLLVAVVVVLFRNGSTTARVGHYQAHRSAEIRLCTVLGVVQEPETASLFAYILLKMPGKSRH